MHRYLSTIVALFLTLNGWSYHTDRSQDWNERNNIVGFEYEINGNVSVEVESPINSHGGDSVFVGGIFTMIDDFSLKAGVASGYTDWWEPYLFPTYEWAYEYWKVDLSITPKVAIIMVKVEI